MKLRFEVYQWCKREDGTTYRNCWRTSHTFEAAMREAKFDRKTIEYCKRKGLKLEPHFILDTLTGEITQVNP